jgi:hypothetical protein
VKPSKLNKTPCQEIKCPDYFIAEGEPAWCFLAGIPVQVAVEKCPKVTGENKDKSGKEKQHG